MAQPSTLAVLDTPADAYVTPTFRSLLLRATLTNALINGVLQFVTANGAQWPTLGLWNRPGAAVDGLGFGHDMLITCGLLSTLCMLTASKDIHDAVASGAVAPLASGASKRGLLGWTPAAIRLPFLRAAATGVFTLLLLGIPSIGGVAAALGGENAAMSGPAYAVFKTLWAAVLAGFVFTLAFPAGLDVANYPQLVEAAGAKGTPVVSLPTAPIPSVPLVSSNGGKKGQ